MNISWLIIIFGGIIAFCGVVVFIYLLWKDEQEEDVWFKARFCPAALTEKDKVVLKNITDELRRCYGPRKENIKKKCGAI